MKKRLLACLTALFVCLSFCACGNDEISPEDFQSNMSKLMQGAAKTAGGAMGDLIKEGTEKVDNYKETIKNSQKKVKGVSIDTPELEFVVTGYTVAKTEDFSRQGEYDLFLFMEFHNNHEERDLSSFSADLTLYQDGITLSGYAFDDSESGTAIRPGAKIDIIRKFELRDKNTDVELVLRGYDYDLHEDTESKYTLKIK